MRGKVAKALRAAARKDATAFTPPRKIVKTRVMRAPIAQVAYAEGTFGRLYKRMKKKWEGK